MGHFSLELFFEPPDQTFERFDHHPRRADPQS
jgi:hypothetical protein